MVPGGRTGGKCGVLYSVGASSQQPAASRTASSMANRRAPKERGLSAPWKLEVPGPWLELPRPAPYLWTLLACSPLASPWCECECEAESRAFAALVKVDAKLRIKSEKVDA